MVHNRKGGFWQVLSDNFDGWSRIQLWQRNADFHPQRVCFDRLHNVTDNMDATSRNIRQGTASLIILIDTLRIVKCSQRSLECQLVDAELECFPHLDEFAFDQHLSTSL